MWFAGKCGTHKKCSKIIYLAHRDLESWEYCSKMFQWIIYVPVAFIEQNPSMTEAASEISVVFISLWSERIEAQATLLERWF